MEELGGAVVRTVVWVGRNALAIGEAVLLGLDIKDVADHQRSERRRRRRGSR
ncbi:hypothetical protein ACWD4V_14640 [Streptomyces tsukubensis]|uniref:hypothetical protein n=1 Tax=Streptomyces tsukubensis TaxID=83656 RepID=UPI0036CF658E